MVRYKTVNNNNNGPSPQASPQRTPITPNQYNSPTRNSFSSPSGILNEEENSINLKNEVNKIIRDPTLIDDVRLRHQVMDCIVADDNYSPLVEKIRHNTGIEYEYILIEKLKTMKIPFLTEEHLRAKGYPKTPDVKLDIPIYINDNFPINWIESKASFGDEYNHANYAKYLFISIYFYLFFFYFFYFYLFLFLFIYFYFLSTFIKLFVGSNFLDTNRGMDLV